MGAVAQLGERLNGIQEVRGSIPRGSTTRLPENRDPRYCVAIVAGFRRVGLPCSSYLRPKSIVTDRLRSYGAAMKALGIVERQECGRRLNNRAENSHQPFRRREGAMAKFRDVKTLQKFASVHASIHNHFNHDRHLNRRYIFKQNRSAAMAEWRQLMA